MGTKDNYDSDLGIWHGKLKKKKRINGIIIPLLLPLFSKWGNFLKTNIYIHT